MARLASLLAASGWLLASASAQNSNSTQQGLHALAVRAGLLFFGTAIDTNNFNDTAYMRVANNRNEFGLLVPENSQKWEPTEPTQNVFEYENPDAVLNLAKTNTQQFRCHTLTWFQQLPQFITQEAWTRETLTEAIESHIANVVGHFKGQCYSWDVVNEALNDNGTFRNSVFFNTLGTEYIPLSFKAAAAADPAAKLYYNDFSLEFNSNKTVGALNIVKMVQDAGERIDGVGFQAHMIVGQTPSRQAMTRVLNRFTELNVEVALTELDVRFSRLPANNSATQQQSADYVSMVGACLDVEKCVGVVVWQFTDKYSWIPSTFPGNGAACLFDENMVRKPAYTAVSNLLAAASTGQSGGSAAPTRGSNGSGGGGGGRGGASNTGSTGTGPLSTADPAIAGSSRSAGASAAAALVMVLFGVLLI